MPGTGTVGFGSGSDLEGVVVSPADAAAAQNPSEAIAADIHAIRDRYVLPPNVFPAQINLAQNVALKIDLSQQTINGFYITVNSGVIFAWVGDFSTVNGVAQTLSHFAISAGVVPETQFFPLPPGNYIITLQANGGAATGYFLSVAL